MYPSVQGIVSPLGEALSDTLRWTRVPVLQQSPAVAAVILYPHRYFIPEGYNHEPSLPTDLVSLFIFRLLHLNPQMTHNFPFKFPLLCLE